MEYGWQGKLVRLVPLDADKHVETAQRWLNDPRVRRTLGMVAFPITKFQEKEYFDNAVKRNPSDIPFAIETLDGRHVGFSGVMGIDWVSRTATTGSFIGDPDDWGKGYGSEAAAIRAWYCFEVINLRMLKSGLLGENIASRKMSEKIGFREYGHLPASQYREGEYKDEVFLYLTREMWVAATGGKRPG